MKSLNSFVTLTQFCLLLVVLFVTILSPLSFTLFFVASILARVKVLATSFAPHDSSPISISLVLT